LLLFPVVLATLSFAQQPDASFSNLPLTPWPASVSLQAGSLPINITFSVSLSGAGATDARVKTAAERLFPRLARQTGIPVRPHFVKQGEGATLAIVVEQRDHPAPQRVGDDESYSLEITTTGARLSAGHPLGALRGIEAFLQLVQQNTEPGVAPGFSAPSITIHDQPRFQWRGLSLDASRHFIPIADVERTLDAMSAVKLNVFHWHLSDDQGFRVESKLYPRLQRFGANGLYYTQAEIRDVIAYARARGIRIVPEFDMPGHATSWLVGYPELGSRPGSFEIVPNYGIFYDLMDPTKESTYRFLDGFIGEMAGLFPDAYFHIGGDEVDPRQWNQNARIQAFMREHHLADAKALQTYFNERIQKIVAAHGKHMVGWDEVLHPGLPKSVVIQSWRGQPSLWQAAREGYQGILSAGYYLDLMYPASYHYSIDPMKVPPPAPGSHPEQGATAPPPGTPTDLTPEQQKKILGGEAAMWEELADPENLDSRLWPRLAAIAERLWSPESITDTASMYHRLDITNRWLEWLGLTQRSNLELMRQRLAGTMPYQPVDIFASVLEPVKGYSRHAENYTTSTPLNRLVDSIPPESDAAREFRNAVDAYLATPANQRNTDSLRKQLGYWLDNIDRVQPILQRNSLLTENLPVADAIRALCEAGQQALGYLDTGKSASAEWKQQTLGKVNQYVNTRVGDLLIQIAPGVQKLVAAVQTQ
jgi:hexosaminidase